MTDTLNTRRRASRFVHTNLLRAIALAPIATVLVGCDDQDNAANTEDTAVTYTFRDAAACTDSGIYTQDTCDKIEKYAVATNSQTSPHYEKLEDCDDDNTGCDVDTRPQYQTNTSTSHGTGVYIFNSSGYTPTYRGFVVGKPAPNSGDPLTVRPVYGSRAGDLATANGIKGFRYNETMTVPRATFSSPIGSSFFRAGQSFSGVTRGASSVGATPIHPSFSGTSARGGFGSGARGFSSFGG